VLRDSESYLPRLGERPYLQGGSIFNRMLDVCDEHLGRDWMHGASVRSFKLEREAHSNGRIWIGDHRPPVEDANAVLIGTWRGGPLHLAFRDEGDKADSIPYDEDSYYEVVEAGTDLSGEFLFPGGRERADFMRGLVGANKLLHQRTDLAGEPLSRIQFLYLKKLDLGCLCQGREDARVRIHNVAFKDRESEVWTINQVDVDAGPARGQFRICYRARKGS